MGFRVKVGTEYTDNREKWGSLTRGEKQVVQGGHGAVTAGEAAIGSVLGDKQVSERQARMRVPFLTK